MTTHNKLLGIAFCVGVASHLGALFLFHNLPLRHPLSSLHKQLFFEEKTHQLFERTQQINEFFDNLVEAEPEVKEELYELKAEYAPSLELAFPREEKLNSPSDEPFAFQSETLETNPFEETEITFLQGTSLITPSPIVTSIENPPLTEIPFEDDPYESFETLAGSEHFTIDVTYVPKQSRPGYIFKLTFYPQPNVKFKRIRQNYFFLIDRSNSIPRARYLLNKKAISHVLDHLKEDDRFNILVFDSRVVRLAETPLPWNEENILLAREFLEKQGHGGHFAATELYASLGKIIPEDVPSTEVNTAILFSDGDTYLSTEKQRLTIGGWTNRNRGKISLFSVASGTGNNLPLLDLLSAFNKGRLIYSSDHRQLNDRLTQLIRTIQNPIGKQMVTTAITIDKQMNILLQPKASRLPDLYQNRAFVIYGSTNRLSDFVIFLQGKYYNRQFDIKKKVSFETAKIGSPSIEKQWTQLLVQEFYERFFEDGNRAHLEAAKQLLVPLSLPTPLARISHPHSSRFGQTVFPYLEETEEGRIKLTLPRMALKAGGNTDGQSGSSAGEKWGLIQ